MIDTGIEEISKAMNIPPVDHDTLRHFILKMAKQMISSHLKITPPAIFVHGLAGVGKTYSVHEVARELAEYLYEKGLLPTPEVSEDPTELCEKVVLREVLAETMTPVDIAPTYIDHEKGVSRKYPPEWLVRLSTRNEEAVKAVEAFKQGEQVSLPVAILLLDELPNAPPDTLKAIQKLLYERKIEDVRLLPTVIIVATGNILEDSVDLSELSNPQKSRMLHLLLRTPTAYEWITYMLSKNVQHNPKVLAFLKAYPSMIYQPPSHGHMAFPCPRAWENAAVLSNNASDEVATVIVSSCCGRNAGEMFANFAASLGGKDPGEYIRDPKAFLRLPTDAKAIVAMSAASRLMDAIVRGKADEEVMAFIISLAKGVPPEKALETMAKLLFARAAAYVKHSKKAKGKDQHLSPEEMAKAIDFVYRLIVGKGNEYTEKFRRICHDRIGDWLPLVDGIEVRKEDKSLNIHEFENALLERGWERSSEQAAMIIATISDAAERAGDKKRLYYMTGLGMVMGTDIFRYVSVE